MELFIIVMLAISLLIAICLLIYASRENSRLINEKNQHKASALKMAMHIAKIQDAESLSEDGELLAMVIYYADIVTGAEIKEGKNLEELTGYIKKRSYGRTMIAKRMIRAVTAHKFLY